MPIEILERKGNIIKAINKRSQKIVWGYVKTLDGKKLRCTVFSSRKDAEKALSALVTQHHMRKLGVGLPAAPVTWKQLVELYLSDARDRGVTTEVISNTKRVLDRFTEMLPADARLTEITSEELRRYRSLRLANDPPLHPHTITFELKRLRTVFLSARALLDVAWDPPKVSGVKPVHQGREVALSSGQINNLLRIATGSVHDFILLGLHTAMRAGELLRLTRRQVDFTEGIDSPHGRLRFVGEKGKREASLPLTAQASATLLKRLGTSGRPEDPVFEEDYHQMRREFIRACKAAGVIYGQDSGGTVIHTLRHSAASYLADQGIPVHILKMITRHSSAHALMKYTHASSKAVGEAMGKLGEIGGE